MSEQIRMRDVYEVPIDERDLLDMSTIHDYLRVTLGFPEYYGKNLSALADCLSEICQPTVITISLNEDDIEPGMQAYVLRFVQVCAREALANEFLSLVIEH